MPSEKTEHYAIQKFIEIDSVNETVNLHHEIDSISNPQTVLSNLWKLATRDIGLLIKELKRPLTKYGLSSYTLWEISMYSIIISQVDLNKSSPKYITLSMMFGYLFGALILQTRFLNMISDRKMITFGYFFSFFSFLPYFFLVPFIQSQYLLIGICYTLHSLGNAFLSPTILSILATGRSTNDQGKILGLVESADTTAFLFATIFVMIYSHYKWPILILFLFSFIAFSISWAYYPLIKRHEKDIYNQNRKA